MRLANFRLGDSKTERPCGARSFSISRLQSQRLAATLRCYTLGPRTELFSGLIATNWNARRNSLQSQSRCRRQNELEAPRAFSGGNRSDAYSISIQAVRN